MSPRREVVIILSFVLCWFCALVLFPVFAIMGEKGSHDGLRLLAFGCMIAAIVLCFTFMVASSLSGAERRSKSKST